MAIVQISRIQHRRGSLNGAPMPQLASGEIGWAIDSQELYIGNGSVAEGAPAVGNTRLLTEKDFANVLDFARTYAYKPGDIQTGETPGSSFYRSLQERLDDTVSVKAFGAIGDGLADDTDAIQRAIDSLYLNGTGHSADEAQRAILYFPPGVYIVSDTIHLPPYATLLGSGKTNTIIRSLDASVFDTVTSLSTPGLYDYSVSVNTDLNPPVVNLNPLPKHVSVSNMSIDSFSDSPAVLLRNCINSVFENMFIKGPWSFVTNIKVAGQAAITLASDYLDTTSGNKFINVDIEGFTYGIYSDYDTRDNSFVSGSIKKCMYGVVFGEGTSLLSELETYVPLYGPRFNTIKDTVFDRISKQGIYVVIGQFNSSENNKFFNVGNDQGEHYLPVFPAVSFLTETNKSVNDFFERATQIFNAIENPNTDYVPDVSGKVRLENNVSNTLSIMENISGYNTYADVVKLPLMVNGKVTVDYVLSGMYLADGTFFRSGTIEIVVDQDGYIAVNDSYEYTGSDLFSGNYIFNAVVRDYAPQPNTGDYQQYQTLVLIVSEIPALTYDRFSYTIRLKS